MLADRDLDARLELVVAAPNGVVDLQDGLDVGKQVHLGQEVADDRSDHRGAPEPATDGDFASDLSDRIADHAEADVVRAGRLPEPVRLGKRAVRWRVADLDEWAADRPVAHGESGDR